MKRKTSICLPAIAAVLLLFPCCSHAGTQADIRSGSDAVTVKQTLCGADGLLEALSSAKEVFSPYDFENALANPDVSSIKYTAADNITVNEKTKTEKPVAFDCGGKVTVKSKMSAAEVKKADGGFFSEDSVGTLIITGTDIDARLKGSTDAVYIKGKNAAVHIYGKTASVIAENADAVIANHSDGSITVTLVNGAKTEIAAKHTYFLKDNTIKKGVSYP